MVPMIDTLSFFGDVHRFASITGGIIFFLIGIANISLGVLFHNSPEYDFLKIKKQVAMAGYGCIALSVIFALFGMYYIMFLAFVTFLCCIFLILYGIRIVFEKSNP